jgi:hypothetical protein
VFLGAMAVRRCDLFVVGGSLVDLTSRPGVTGFAHSQRIG